MTARRTALLTLLALVAGLLPLTFLATPAAAAPGSASGTLDFDRVSGGLDDFDLGYTIQVSNTTPAAGDDVTVTITWDEASVSQPFAYTNVNLCWDAPAGWAGAGGVPTTQDYDVYTPADTPLQGEVVGTDVPGDPMATANFTSAAASGERADITSYGTGASKVFRFCAHADSIDARESGLVDTTDTIAGSMTVTLEAPASGPAQFEGLLATAEYVEGGSSVPPPPYVALEPMQSPGSTSQTLGGTPTDASYDYTDSGGSPSTPIAVTPTGALITYSLETPPSHGTAVVEPDGGYTYTPTTGFTGDDSFQVRVSDGDGFSISTVNVAVLPNEAAISVTKSAEETSVLVGESIHYTVTIANTGGLVVEDITVTDPNAPGCATTIPSLAVQTSEDVTCTYTATAGDVGTYANVATASSPDLTAPVDSNQVDVQVVNAATPRLEIRKSTTQTSVEVGSDITYEIEVLNSGGIPLTGVAVSDPNAPDCERTIGNLAAGARSVYSCSLTATAGMVGNRGNVATADSNETDPVPSGNVVVAVTPGDGTTGVPYECVPPGLAPIATTIPITAADDIDPASPGQTVTWTFRNSNPSIDTGIEADLNWIQVEYAVPSGVQDAELTLVNPPGQTANPTIANSTVNSPASGASVRFRTPNTGT
ncbi:MAG TPA: Ig-like domain-containing protein, partial [Acidimicrobiales bacterium]|nr:Ig-like domain-containing protein [Acidimicrobiales bacterium]